MTSDSGRTIVKGGSGLDVGEKISVPRGELSSGAKKEEKSMWLWICGGSERIAEARSRRSVRMARRRRRTMRMPLRRRRERVGGGEVVTVKSTVVGDGRRMRRYGVVLSMVD